MTSSPPSPPSPRVSPCLPSRNGKKTGGGTNTRKGERRGRRHLSYFLQRRSFHSASRSSLPPSLLHFSREDEDKCGGREGRKGLAAAPPLPPFSQTGPSFLSYVAVHFGVASTTFPRSSYFSPGLSRRKAAPATGTKGATLPRRRPNLPGAQALPPWYSEPCAAKPTQIFLRCDEKRKKETSP